MSQPLGPLPEILTQPLIPPPLHGVNPRTIMGRSAWDRLRREVYSRHGQRCAVCGVASREALLKRGLEAHEYFSVVPETKTMTLISIEPLCHACHRCCHPGLLEVLLHQNALSRDDALTIVSHGISILRRSSRAIPAALNVVVTKLGIRHELKTIPAPPLNGWSGWKMVWDGKSYPSPYRNEAEWRSAMRKQNAKR